MERINVMVVGLPGNMASLVATKIKESKDMTLNKVGLSHLTNKDFVGPFFSLRLVSVAGHLRAIEKNKPDIIVDFSTSTPERNCDLFCKCGIPFVMGATGGMFDFMSKRVKDSNISAVIAPNMAAPIVVLQAMLEYAAENFSGVFDDCSLKIAESHQRMKKDVSGTALVFERLLNTMGAISDKDGILSIRDPLIQKRLCGISEDDLDGHGHHEYVLVSNDKTVHISLSHGIDGRNAYVDGAIKAIRFLAQKSDKHGEVFSMTDVLKA